MWRLGCLYESDIAGKENLHRAVFYFRMASNSGHHEAQMKTEMYYTRGIGVQRPLKYDEDTFE